MNIYEVIKRENKGRRYTNGEDLFVADMFNGRLTLLNENGDFIEQVYYLEDILNMDFKEEVDWSKVPVDAPILVKNHEGDIWEKRRFAKYENGRIYAWLGGKDSFTAFSENDVTIWEYVKLYNKEEDGEI